MRRAQPPPLVSSDLFLIYCILDWRLRNADKRERKSSSWYAEDQHLGWSVPLMTCSVLARLSLMPHTACLLSLGTDGSTEQNSNLDGCSDKGGCHHRCCLTPCQSNHPPSQRMTKNWISIKRGGFIMQDDHHPFDIWGKLKAFCQSSIISIFPRGWTHTLRKNQIPTVNSVSCFTV